MSELKNYFDNATSLQLRGADTESELIRHAAHILEQTRPKQNSNLLDIGCGDGKLMKKISIFRPDLKIDGLDLSDNLASQAREINPDSNISSGDILDIELPSSAYDVIFSFSFLQYIPPEKVVALQSKLIASVKPGGLLIHCSIPNLEMRGANIAVGQFRKYGKHAMWRTPLIFLHQKLVNGNRYGNGYWYDPKRLCDSLQSIAEHQVLDADVYYRFDLSVGA